MSDLCNDECLLIELIESQDLRDPTSRPGTEPVLPSAVKTRSFNHWTTREFLSFRFLLAINHVTDASVKKLPSFTSAKKKKNQTNRKEAEPQTSGKCFVDKNAGKKHSSTVKEDFVTISMLVTSLLMSGND